MKKISESKEKYLRLRSLRVNQILDIFCIAPNTPRQKLFEILKNQDNKNDVKLWSISFESFVKYLGFANKHLKKEITTEQKLKIAKINKRRYEDLYSKMYRNQDYKGALLAADKLEKLLQIGYYSKSQTENNISIQNSIPSEVKITIVKSDLRDLNEITTFE